MIFFKKKKSEGYVIDLGKMRERGIIKDTAKATDSASSINSDSSSVSTDSLGFIGSLASAGNESASSVIATDGAGIKEIEDKISALSGRLYKILDRLDLIEHKLGRIERRNGYGESY